MIVCVRIEAGEGGLTNEKCESGYGAARRALARNPMMLKGETLGTTGRG